MFAPSCKSIFEKINVLVGLGVVVANSWFSFIKSSSSVVSSSVVPAIVAVVWFVIDESVGDVIVGALGTGGEKIISKV